MLLSNFKFYFN